MKLNWELVLDQLMYLKSGYSPKLDNLTIDTLYGSMFGLNFRYVNLFDLLKDENKKQKLVAYSIARISKIKYNFTYTKRTSIRGSVGYGTYKWNYDCNLIREAVNNGVSIIDTAEGYGYGKVEKKLGEFLQNYNDSSINVFTKVRRDHMSPFAIMNAMKRSITTLKIKPHIQLHYPNNLYPEAIKYSAELNNKGIIKSIGLGNCSIDMIESAQSLINDTYPGVVINSVQVSFSLLNSRIISKLLPYCQDRGILVIAYSPLGQDFKLIDSPLIQKIAKKYNATVAQIALSWVLSHKGVIPIPQTNNIKHLRQNIESNDLILDEDDVLNLTEYYSKSH